MSIEQLPERRPITAGLTPEEGMPSVDSRVVTVGLKADQNSPLRVISKEIERAMLHIPPRFRVHPDWLNRAGGIGVGLGCLILYASSKDQKNEGLGLRKIGLGVTGAANVLDFFDGPAANVYPDRKKIDRVGGAVRDHKYDVVKDGIMGLARMILVGEDYDLLGEVAATAATITANLPKIAKAWRLWHDGVTVPEFDVGTAAVRVPVEILALAARLYPGLKKPINVQFFADTFITLASIQTAIDRLQYKPEAHPTKQLKQPIPDDIEIARRKLNVTIKSQAVILAFAAATYFYLHRKPKG
jgi:hypothetical protein